MTSTATRSRAGRIAVLACLAALAGGCGERTDEADGAGSVDRATAVSDGDRFPDVVDAVARQADDGAWTFDVTLSSPYDTPERYADAWRVVAPDGTVLGVRELLHDHAGEQPFTRSLSGVVVGDDVDVVTIEGRDLANGWGGATLELTLPRG